MTMTYSVCGKESHICLHCFLGEQSSRYIRLVDAIQHLGWGRISLIVKDGKITMIESLQQNIKLDGDVTGL